MRPKPTSIFLAVLGAFALGACNVIPPAQDDPTHYFVLTDPAAPAAHAGGALRVGLHTVAVAGYLRHREMVVRTGSNELEFKDYRLWAEPLDSAFTRVLRVGLQNSPSVASVSVEPFTMAQDRDYDVAVTILACEGAGLGGNQSVARLSAIVEVYSASDSKLVLRTRFNAPEKPWDGRSYDALASLLSADAAELADAVASALPAKN